ncbi:MAG: pyridoxamine 5'-phosphate oxidase family protein [Gammaproteobacteria bacterium]|nr:pyridoxamine 5'-phosphate oxidase family protein [Gammaproteobacteria bacterium]
MGDRFKELNEKHIKFINKQHMFFVGTAGAEGYLNVSPKGMDSFRIINNSKVVWLNLTGSGNETAAHMLENSRMTLMFCSFDKKPMILRIYGHARTIYPRNKEWAELTKRFPAYISTRQFYELEVELVQNSCGYAVPYYEFTGQRNTLEAIHEKIGKSGVEKYWQENNSKSMNNKPTGIFED